VTILTDAQNGKKGLARGNAASLGRGVKPFVVVGVPAFNEEKTIGRVVLQSQKHADKVVVCDDGCSDLTGEIAERLGAEVVRHDRRLGYGAAIQTLFERARNLGADVLVTLDGDGQHDPNDIPSVVQPIMKGEADITVGSRFVDKHLASVMPWYRRAGIKFISKLVDNNTKQGVVDAQSGFRAYSVKSLDKLEVAENGMGASVEILLSARKQGLRIQEVPTSCDYRADRRNHVHNPVRHGANVLMSIVKLVVEDRPLLFLGIPGILCLATGAFFGVWMLQLYGAEHRIVTNVALASVAFVLIGFFMLSTGITLYAISRLAERTNGKR
jgi:glycosyltransferase involved in cell wall biosynthesis